MRIVGAVLGWLLILAASAEAGWEALDAAVTGEFRLRPAGELWYQIDAPSLNLVQAVIERYVWPPLWDPVIAGALHWPAALILAVPGVLLVLLGHRRALRRRKWRFRK
ncbi:MAG: hypothetical protein ACE5KF_12940 [Kiloniellaceae bacterium]